MEEKSFGIIPVRMSPEGLRFLIVEQYGNWVLPKGRPDAGESETQTATREFGEETGLELEKIFAQKTYLEEFEFRRGDSPVHKTVTYFLGIPRPGVVKVQPEEIQNFAWVSYEEALEKVSYPEIKKILMEAHQDAQRLISRMDGLS